jgi:hypothetical protein
MVRASPRVSKTLSQSFDFGKIEKTHLQELSISPLWHLGKK